MKKEKLVTRTFDLTEVDLLLCNTTTAELYHHYPVYIGTLDEKQALARARKELEDDTVKVVTATITDTRTELRGMSESQFYDNSVLLPARKVGVENE